MIEKYENGYAIAYNDSRTILSAMYGVYKVEGVVLGNEYAVLNGTDYDESMMDGKTLLAAGYKIIASTTSNTMVEDPDHQEGHYLLMRRPPWSTWARPSPCTSARISILPTPRFWA